LLYSRALWNPETTLPMQQKLMKRWFTFAVGLLISGITLTLAFQQANFATMLQTFESARYEFVVLASILIIVGTAARGLRWSVLTQGRLSIADAIWLFNIGLLFNNILPARLGEIVRTVLASRRPSMHFTSALSSIVVERLFDMISVVFLIGIALIGLGLPRWAASAGALMGIGAVGGILVLALTVRYPNRAIQIGVEVLGRLPRIHADRAEAFLKPFVDGLGALSDLRTFALGLSLSLIAWIISSLSAWVLMFAFWERMPLINGILVIAAAGLGVAVPAAPAGLGPFEVAVVGVLRASGYDADVSRTYAISIHLIGWALTNILGVMALLHEGLSFTEITHAAEALTEHQPVEPAPIGVPPV
jgi:glycosyltransferase 2 family protein